MKSVQQKSIATRIVDMLEHIRTYRVSAIAILVINLSMIIGVIFDNWNIFNIMFLYWMESVVIGFFTVFRMMNTKNSLLAKFFFIPSFGISYGFLTFGYGLIVYSIFAMTFMNLQSGENGISINSYLDGSYLVDVFSGRPELAIPLLFFIINQVYALRLSVKNENRYNEDEIGEISTTAFARIIKVYLAMLLMGIGVTIVNSFLNSFSVSEKLSEAVSIKITIVMVLLILTNTAINLNADKNKN